MNPEERREQFQREQARKELRDQFAGQALGMFQVSAHNTLHEVDKGNTQTLDEITKAAYLFADAMLAAR